MVKVLSGVWNCHAKNVHSIVLDTNSDGGLRRIFIAEPGHDLWRNVSGQKESLSVGFHTHHCDLTISVLRGRVSNVSLEYGNTKQLRPWLYSSTLRGQEPGFRRLGKPQEFSAREKVMHVGDSIALASKDMHTIAVPEGEAACWLIVEGKEDSRYESLTWSDADLSAFDFSNMYQPMTGSECHGLLSYYDLTELADERPF